MKSFKYKIRLSYSWIFLLLHLFILSSNGFGQTTIFTDPGESYTNTDSRTEDFYNVDISACNSIVVSLDYEFSLPWIGPSPTMEKEDECGTCNGDPDNQSPDCTDQGNFPEGCWDFLWVRVFIDGVAQGQELIGDASTTNNEQSGTISFTLCVQQANNLDIEVYTQTWAITESIDFTNITVDCWSDYPMPTATPNPACEGESVQLDETSGSFTNWTWSGPNGFTANSKDPVIPNFTSGNAGTYTVTADDANGCAVSETIDIQLAPVPPINSGESIEACGTAPVSFDLTSVEPELNPTPGLIFEWYEDMNGMTLISNPMNYSSSGGTVYVSALDPSSGCYSDTVAVTLIVHPQPTFTVPSDVSVCEGLQVEMDTLINPSNTSLNYTYHDGVPPTSANQLMGVVTFNSNTTISVVGTDANGCADTQYVNLTVIPIPVAPPADNSGPYCEGETITLNATPPIIPGLTYTWTGPNGYSATGPTQTITNATINDEGIYELTASLSGCTSQTTTIFVDIIELPSTPTVTDPTYVCFGDSLILTAMSDPGASYSWSGPNGFSSSVQNPLVTPSADYSHEGIYTITPTLNGCTGMPADLEVIVNDTPTVLLTVVDSISCPGDADGAISVNVPGGVPPLTYDWSNDLYDGMNFISGLSAGTYTLTVIDGNGCTNAASLIIEDPPSLQLFCDQVQSESAPGAMDGVGEIFIQGGNEPFIIIYENSSGGADTIFNASSGSNLISNLSEDSYEVLVTDNNGCTAECTLIITGQNCQISIDTIYILDSIKCFGDSTATLEVIVSGGSGNYGYVWEDAGGTPVSDSSKAVNLGGGTYYIFVADLDDAGCATSGSKFVSQPFAVDLFNCSETQSESGPGLEDGAALIQMSGGTQPYSITWSGPLIDSSTVSNDSLIIDSLPAGDYDVVLTDDYGCEDSCSFTIQGANCNISLELDTTYFTACPTDSSLTIETSVTNGTNNIVYIWNSDTLNAGDRANLWAGNYTIEVLDTLSACSDAITVDQSNYQNLEFECVVFSPPSGPGTMDGEGAVIFTSVAKPYEAIIKGGMMPVIISDERLDTLPLFTLDTGTYTIVITDSLGCMDSCMFTVSPPGCNMTLNLDTAYFDACPGDSTLTIITSLDSTYSNIVYVWNDDTLNTGVRSNLASGIYTIMALDTVNGCNSNITVDMESTYSLSFDCLVFEPPSVKGGRNGEGGIIINSIATPYDVLINGHNYTNSQMDVLADSIIFNNLDSGMYTVTITDSFGCSDTCSFYMPDGGCDFLSVDSIVSVQPDCNAPMGGSLEVFVSGGSGNYDYDWSVDSLDGMRLITDLGPGTYDLTVTDTDLNCVVQASHTLFPIDELEINLDYASSFCMGDSVGIQIELISASAPLEISVNGFSSGFFSTDTAIYVSSGNPTIEIMDNDGCIFTESLSITELNNPASTLDTMICANESIELGGMTFNENNPSGMITLKNAAQNGCDSIVEVNVSFQSLSFEYDIIPPSCEMGTNTQVEFINAIGTNNFTFYLNDKVYNIPQLPHIIDGLEMGMNSFYIESDQACQSSVQTVIVEEPQTLEVEIADIVPISAGDSTILEGQTTEDFTTVNWVPVEYLRCDTCLVTAAFPESTTTYQLTITDQNGCMGQAEVTVIVNEEKNPIYIPNTFTPNGDGLNDFFTVYTKEGIAQIKRLLIFDRWGGLLFETRDIAPNVEELGWDGRSNGNELAPGVYVYTIELLSSTGQSTIYHGSITLLK